MYYLDRRKAGKQSPLILLYPVQSEYCYEMEYRFLWQVEKLEIFYKQSETFEHKRVIETYTY